MTRLPSIRGLSIGTGLAASALVVSCQWLIVMSFVAHSYSWLIKVDDPVVTAGIVGMVLFSVGSLAAVLFSLWSHGQFYGRHPRLSFLAQLVGLAGLSGLLVFFGMASAGYVLFVQR